MNLKEEGGNWSASVILIPKELRPGYKNVSRFFYVNY